MQTLSHGYKKPSNPDTGDVFFPAMEANIQLMNDHTHNGTDGNLLAVATVNLLAANWVASTFGLYYQDVALPSGTGYQYNYDSCQIDFRLSTGEMVFPSVSRNSSTSMRVFTNNNALSYVAMFR